MRARDSCWLTNYDGGAMEVGAKGGGVGGTCVCSKRGAGFAKVGSMRGVHGLPVGNDVVVLRATFMVL